MDVIHMFLLSVGVQILLRRDKACLAPTQARPNTNTFSEER